MARFFFSVSVILLQASIEKRDNPGPSLHVSNNRAKVDLCGDCA